jgi:hypothetical protein
MALGQWCCRLIKPGLEKLKFVLILAIGSLVRGGERVDIVLSREEWIVSINILMSRSITFFELKNAIFIAARMWQEIGNRISLISE